MNGPLKPCWILGWLLLFVCVLSQPGFSQDGENAESPAAQKSDAQKGDAEKSETQRPLPEIKPLIKSIHPSMVTIRVSGRDGGERGIGAGFVIDPSGLIATNHHVIGEGRSFTVQRYSGRDGERGERLKVLAVEASDRNADLAIIRVDTEGMDLPALQLSDAAEVEQGTRVVAFGNPLGMQQSVVEGIVSAVREIEGQSMLQLAMPTQPGNSGGPLVTFDKKVVGIVNMKSAVDDNLGFAIPAVRLRDLIESPNPILIERWVRMGKLDESVWKSVFGANWKQRGGMISARGQGAGFGGRALCLRVEQPAEKPFEIAVDVRLNDPSGAAGLVFCSDGEHKHYGFYPSAGKMRLTCFKGPSVYSWDILHEVATPHYVPGQWNRLRVRCDAESIRCFVNGELVLESSDRQLVAGKVGLAKFRGTQPDFKHFRLGVDLTETPVSEQVKTWLDENAPSIEPMVSVETRDLDELAESSDSAARILRQRSAALKQRAESLEKLADDVQRRHTLSELREVLKADSDDRLARATLLIAKLDSPELDVDAYLEQIASMVSEIQEGLEKDSDSATRRKALDQYLFTDNGFHGGRAEYYHVANSHLNRVIDDREGLPITLSILYMEMGRRLDLTIQGIGLPGHFVTQFVDGDFKQLIDPFDGGKELSMSDARTMVAQYAGRRFRDEDLRAQSHEEILTRVLSNLIGIATRGEDVEAMLRYIDPIVLINPEMADYRMMRAQLRGLSGRKRQAIEDLNWLLDREPVGIDLRRVRQLMNALENAR